MNEHELLQSIYNTTTTHAGITIAPGDDMGEMQIGSERILCAVDQLIVGRHVTQDVSPEIIGRKAIARCFSDIAAMAAIPVGSLMTACVPAKTSNQWCEALFLGATKVAEQWGGPIFGGDISCSEGPALFTVTAIASPPECGAITRRGAQAGDYLCVTGELGNSIAGHHLTFTPRIGQAQELLEVLGDNLHSMIDISDGLGQDAAHLASNELQMVIDTQLLPLRTGATVQGAIADGEDYELLFTSAALPPTHLATVIGSVQEGGNKAVTTAGEVISTCGWNHQCP
ncbi:MAG: thiamine-monophosphate kinase [Planctomycetes bacterium]|nr:thiamine-monophosphate kinase [Planctomycetota bacterium]